MPLVEATRGMIDAGGVAQMKPGAVVLNFSRGGVVDEAAVLEALRERPAVPLRLRLPGGRTCTASPG